VPIRFAAFARRPAVVVLVLASTALAGACSTPRTASGSLEQGKQRVTQLLLDAAHTLPATAKFRPPTEVGAEPCRRTLAGYVVGETGAHRAQIALVVNLPGTALASTYLPELESAWKSSGYRLDTSRIHEGRFPQVRATTPDGYDVVATAFVPSTAPPINTVNPQIDLYAVSQCLRGH